jgi:heme/copper-type cytochrome/quinol oxidase subunit 2
MTRGPRKLATALAVTVVAAAAFLAGGAAGGRGQVREIAITGDQFAFSPVRIEVQKDDLIQIKFTARDVAHSFTIDVPYRISKRAGAGQSVVFEFRADEAGRFPFYCNLTQDERCKQMKGELVVR